MTRLLIVAATFAMFALLGCSAAPNRSVPPLPPDHPANPRAAEAPMTQRSVTLRIDAGAPTTTAPSPSPDSAHEGHGEHH